jgi:hypothetical protein
MRLQEIATAAQAHELAPAAPIRMAVGADIPQADPAVIGTGGMRAEVPGRIDHTTTAAEESHPWWRDARRLRVRRSFPLTQCAHGLARETCEWFGVALWPGRFRRRACFLARSPPPPGQESQQEEENTRNERDSQVASHDQALHSCGTWADHTVWGVMMNYPHGCHTRPIDALRRNLKRALA